MASILERVLRVGEGRTLRRLENYAAAINALEDDFQALSDEELKHETVELRERYANGESLDDLLPEAFAAVREASQPHPRPAPLRRAAHGRRGPAPRQHRRDEDR